MRLSRKDSMEELKKIDLVMNKINNSNLDDQAKEYILHILQKRVFEIRNDLSKIQKDVEIYKAK